MKGIQLLTDQHGNPKSIVLDIQARPDLWASLRDAILSERDDAPRASTKADAAPSAEPNGGSLNDAQPKSEPAAAQSTNPAAVNAASLDLPPTPSFADRLDALYEQPASPTRAAAMLRLIKQATPADNAELLKREIAKLTDEDRRQMREFAEEGLEEDLKNWPKYDDADDAPTIADADEAAFQRELAKIDDDYRRQMKTLADEGLPEDLNHWPEYDAASDAISPEPSPTPTFADRMDALYEQPASPARAAAMLRLIKQATPADNAELLKRELAKLTDEDRSEMREFAEEGLEEDLKNWPEY